MGILKVKGSLVDQSEELNGLERVFSLAEFVQVSQSRSETGETTLQCAEEDLISLSFADGTEWIGPANDVLEIFPEELKRSNSDELHIPTRLRSNGSRALGGVDLKWVKRYVIKQGATVAVGPIAKKFEDWLTRDHSLGLYALGPELELLDVDWNASTSNKYLLLIHGVMSSINGSFGRMLEETDKKLWSEMRLRYEGRVLGYQHRSLTLSPIDNAIEVLQGLPVGTEIEILSTSRGGLVSDVLARCDCRNEVCGFSEREIAKIRTDDERQAKDEGWRDKKEENWLSTKMKLLNELAKQKRIRVSKAIRIACPAAGTVLLDRRLDHFMNVLLRGIGLAFGPGQQAYDILRTFVMEIIAARANTRDLAGLACMMPNSEFLKILNSNRHKVHRKLLTIEGDSRVGRNVPRSLLVIFTNLFYQQQSDLVVNTSSMRKGVSSLSPAYYFLSHTPETNHFRYFRNSNTLEAILNGIRWNGISVPEGFSSASSSDRGSIATGVDFFFPGALDIEQPSGEKPIVILLPGVMGSHLDVDGKRIWISQSELFEGGFSKYLNIETEVSSTSVIKRYYGDLALALKDANYDVRVFPYDWRSSLFKAARDLRTLIEQCLEFEQPLKLVAHSMGGRVVQCMMLKYDSVWKRFINREHSRFLMLGTPWLGSHKILSLMTGRDLTMRTLAGWDQDKCTYDLTKVVQEYPALYELLPMDGGDSRNDLFDADTESKLKSSSYPIPAGRQFDAFENFKREYEKKFSKIDLSKIYYIAGKSKCTIDGYRIIDKHSTKELYFDYTAEGDGTVTWKLGFPPGLPEENRYYACTQHANLPRDPELFPGIIDILASGQTSQIRSTPAETCSWFWNLFRGDRSNAYHEVDELMGIEYFEADEEIYPSDPIRVSVVNGHLKQSSYPLMVGHFMNDGIVSAELALNQQLENRLQEYKDLGTYPGRIGENLILLNHDGNIPGGIIVGLGERQRLNSYNLVKTVEAAIINYILEIRNQGAETRDNCKGKLNTILIGSDYGKMSMESSLTAILLGVRNANERIRTATGACNSKLQQIDRIEFIELYEDVARQAYYALKRIQKGNKLLVLQLTEGIRIRHGALKRLPNIKGKDWWNQMSVDYIKADLQIGQHAGLRFTASEGLARVEEQRTFAHPTILRSLMKEMSASSLWDPELAKALFELMIPNNFKSLIREQSNIHWRVDAKTAEIPWEMFHDRDFDREPTFTRAGLIRQFVFDEYRIDPPVIRTKTALVIGDPIYDFPGYKLDQLEHAVIEARSIQKLLVSEQNNYNSLPLIGRNATEIIKAFVRNRFKILHIAAHGIFEPEKGDVGIVIGDALLTPAMIANISYVPDFVFINCCYSGEVRNAVETVNLNKYKFAGNIGTEFIRQGASAVVVAGWEIDDEAAALFATTLYESMLAGEHFGVAVKTARRLCYEHFQYSNTWGAYQCYGDPFYQFDPGLPPATDPNEFVTKAEVLVALQNAIAKTTKVASKHDYLQKIKIFEQLLKRIDASKFADEAEVWELEGQFWDQMDMSASAIDRFATLLSTNKATFSVKSLERYFNLRSKRLSSLHVSLIANDIKQIRSFLKGDKNFGANPKAYEKLSAAKLRAYCKKLFDVEVQEIRDFLEGIDHIGRTAERQALLGSLEKRLAALPGFPIAKHLTDAATYYRMSFEMLQKDSASINELAYPLSNWLTANFFLNGNKELNEVGETPTPLDFLEAKLSELQSDQYVDGTDFWQENPFVNLSICRMLYLPFKLIPSKTGRKTRLKNELKATYDSVLKVYKKAWDEGGNYSNLSTEIEHLDIILEISNQIGAVQEKNKKLDCNILDEEVVKVLIKLKQEIVDMRKK